MPKSKLYRFAAFTESLDGGNPAGIWLGEELPCEPEMQAIAAEVGYSASEILLGRLEGPGTYVFSTAVGDVKVAVKNDGARWLASRTSVDTKQKPATIALLSAALDALRWSKGYDFTQLKLLILEHELTTLQLLWKEYENVFHSRNPFPVVGVVEDPATDAWLQHLAAIFETPAWFRHHYQFVFTKVTTWGVQAFWLWIFQNRAVSS